MDHSKESLFHLLVMYYSPWALPHKVAATNANKMERQRIYHENMIHLRPYMREYIHRSAHLLVVFYVLFLLFSLFVPLYIFAVLMGIGAMLAILHTVFLIFMQQEANNIATEKGERNSMVGKKGKDRND